MLRLFFVAVLLYLIILAGAYLFLFQRGYIGPGFFENVLPLIEIESAPDGIGINPARFVIRVSDSGAGLDEVKVRGQQARRKFDLLTKFYQQGALKEDIVELNVAGQEQGLREGSVTVTISVFDRSFFNNKAVKTLEIPVDYRKPRLEVLSAQHNANEGGVEFAFYKLMDGTAVNSGVQVGDIRFPGYPAKLLDREFENMPEVYFSFFAVPAGFRPPASGNIAAFASNRVGNTNLTSFYYHITLRRFRTDVMNLPSYTVRTKLEEILTNTDGDPENLPLDAGGLAAKLKSMQNSFYTRLSDQFRKFELSTVRGQLWRVPFQRPVGGALRAGFGEKIDYFCDGIEAGSEEHAGLDLASPLRSSVFAVNEGQVVLASYFGLYGNTVVIDHGFGLFSLYAHLSSFRVKAGDRILSGTEIGRTGMSGFSDSDHLHFEMRLGKVPVNPVEWWDTRWINDHIIAKTHGILGQATSQPAGEAE